MSDVEAGRCANRKVELVHVIGHHPAYGYRFFVFGFRTVEQQAQFPEPET